jgi:hypothetical protein
VPGLDAIREEAAALACLRAGVRVDGHGLVFATNSEAVLDWPRSYLAPVCTFGPAPAASGLFVGVVRASALHRRCRALIDAMGGGAPSATYEDEPATRFRSADGALALAYDRRPGVTLVDAAREQVWFVTDDDDSYAPFEAARLIRELFTKALERDGWVVLHAGAVSLGGRGWIVCGPKYAGKTTLVCQLVEDAGAEFVANDRIYIRGRDGGPRLLAWPMSVRIGIGTCLGSRALRPLLAGGRFEYPQTGWDPAAGIRDPGALALATGPSGPKIELTPRELVAVLGSRAVAGADASAVVLPRRDPGGPAAAIRRVAAGDEEAVESLGEQLLTPDDDSYPDWLELRRAAPERLAEDALDLVRRLVGTLPVVELRFSDAGAAVRALTAEIGRKE